MCFDPKDWKLSVKIDNTANGEWQLVYIGLELCDIEVDSKNCLDEEALKRWFKENVLSFESIYP